MQNLIGQYPNLQPVEKGKYPNQTLAAKNIRKELKANFPKIKFSVKSKSYSMGDSIDVTWTDGPATKEVAGIIDKYQYGWFDGMTDCYNSHHNKFNDIFGGTKHLFCNREYSSNTLNKVIKTVWDKFGITEQLLTADNFKNGELWYVKKGAVNAQTLVHQELQALSAI